MTSSLESLFRTLFFGWLDAGAAPDAPVEGVTPELTAMLGREPAEVSFDALLHRAPQPGWLWRALEFRTLFDGGFFFYLPAAWDELAQEGAWAWLSEGGAARQSIVVSHESFWREHARGVVEGGRVLAFSYEPLLRPSYHQWLYVVADAAGQGVTAYGAWSAGEWVVEAAGPAADGAELGLQLAALANSNPWHGWIAAARAQRAPSDAE